MKMMVFERRGEKVVDFDKLYRASVPAIGRCEVALRTEKMEGVKEFKYQGIVLCKHGEKKEEIRERTVKVKCVIRSFARVMRGRNVSMEIKKSLRNS